MRSEGRCTKGKKEGRIIGEGKGQNKEREVSPTRYRDHSGGRTEKIGHKRARAKKTKHLVKVGGKAAFLHSGSKKESDAAKFLDCAIGGPGKRPKRGKDPDVPASCYWHFEKKPKACDR